MVFQKRMVKGDKKNKREYERKKAQGALPTIRTTVIRWIPAAGKMENLAKPVFAAYPQRRISGE